MLTKSGQTWTRKASDYSPRVNIIPSANGVEERVAKVKAPLGSRTLRIISRRVFNQLKQYGSPVRMMGEKSLVRIAVRSVRALAEASPWANCISPAQPIVEVETGPEMSSDLSHVTQLLRDSAAAPAPAFCLLTPATPLPFPSMLLFGNCSMFIYKLTCLEPGIWHPWFWLRSSIFFPFCLVC